MPTRYTMPSIRRRVLRALRHLLVGGPHVTDHKRLHEDYHFSDYDRLELALNLEREFQLTLYDHDIAGFSTVGSVVACVRRHLAC